MTQLRRFEFSAVDLDGLAECSGRMALLINAEGRMSPAARRLNRLTKGALARVLASDRWQKAKTGEMVTLTYPAGLAVEALDVVKLERRGTAAEARSAGAALAVATGTMALTVVAESTARLPHLALGLALRGHAVVNHKSESSEAPATATILCAKPDETSKAAASLLAVGEGVAFTRDLVSEPANVLTTEEFAGRLQELTALGIEVEVLEEARMAELGMNALLAVGQGSAAPSKMVVMRWKGAEGDPLALVGKGVVFDTGGISLKPGPGMEDMTMDMGGAGTVAGVMKALALRKAKAHVVGLVGLVENMPSGTAMRPGDIVASMKGDTIEILNTDAEGRLVLCDVLWYAQQHVKPIAMVDLATLTGACIVALGHENAAVYANDDGFADAFLKAAKAEGEGAWRMPLGQAYDDMLKSPLADMKNIGGRPAGSITAAQFLKRFVKDDMPWIHLDIAGVAKLKSASLLAPAGATGWGVLSLDRLIRDRFESKDG
ncbi:leucyl aminopeptidase [Salipiger mangrovisoli]|uniref:Probable cytosol aminopeptidase n=1 Tax=Salipiger mangrovisoli TaxID=2865933 RepID=A0ABR9WWM2_9RHOB|nr:leucyl aminopeptidase [Salipiger mangrovisoli]MBE9635689.1 leucyl aminopeptidase [Salipiger mangrovisoli]